MGLVYWSCSAQCPSVLGLARARDNVQKAPNQSTIVKPYLAKILFFDGACLLELLSTVSLLAGAGGGKTTIPM